MQNGLTVRMAYPPPSFFVRASGPQNYWIERGAADLVEGVETCTIGASQVAG
jgi:hypothetical protein